MMANPKVDAACVVHYRAAVARSMPLHGKVGRVAVRAKGRPRNHGVEIDGTLYVVPCGNLRPVPAEKGA
jgi:hypothetical protein